MLGNHSGVHMRRCQTADAGSHVRGTPAEGLCALLKASREDRAAVSTALSGQVLGALHELLHGLNAAEPAMIQDLADKRPEHLYDGLLTVLLRLVFVLYAEDRDLLPRRR